MSVIAVFPLFAHATTLSLFPATGVVTVNEIVIVDIYAESATEPVNAVSGTITFPKNLLSVESISKKESALDWWTIEPTLSGAGGVITFEGVALKGFSGLKRKILSITFKGRAVGSAEIAFSTGSILASDGSGNNVLSEIKGAQFTVRESFFLATSTSTIALNSTSTIVIAAPLKEIADDIPPSIRTYNPKKSPDMPLIIGRDAYPYATIRAFFKDAGGSIRLHEMQADDRGDFIVDPNAQLPHNNYTVWVETMDGRSAKITQSNTVTISAARAPNIPILYILIGIGITILVAVWPERSPIEEVQLNT